MSPLNKTVKKLFDTPLKWNKFQEGNQNSKLLELI